MLNAAGLRTLQRRAQKEFNFLGHGGEAFIFGQALVIPEINLLNDGRQFEARESEVESNL